MRRKSNCFSCGISTALKRLEEKNILEGSIA
jgi:hypothetical protein